MKKEYTKPELEILVLKSDDIIMSSPQVGTAVMPGDNAQDWNVL